MSNPKAKITKNDGFDCAPQGHTIVNFPAGTIVTGVIAEWAIAAKAAKAMGPAEKAPAKKKALKTKGAGGAPENKKA